MNRRGGVTARSEHVAEQVRGAPGTRTGPRRSQLVVVLAALAGLLVAAGVIAGSPELPSDLERVDLGVARRIDGDVMAMGRLDAPVVMVEYADYRCGSCAVFARDTMPRLIEEYVNSGLLRYEWRDLPVLGEESFDAAVAARAAGRQDRLWAYQAVLFDQTAQGHLAIDRSRLLDFARTAGVPDLARFERDLDDPVPADQVNADIEEAESIGVNATPMFVVGQMPLWGAQPIEVFRHVVDDELAHAGAR
jgi:protein-disulfide isomerase